MERRLPVLAAFVVLALLIAAPPAAAHGQKVRISLEAVPADPPSAVEITAVVSFEDGHRVDGVTLTTTAVSGTNQVEIPLAAAGEAGTYTGTAELAPGAWEITTEATGDYTGTAVTDVTVTPPTTTAVPTPEPEAAPALPDEPTAAEEQDEGGINLALVLIPLGVAVIGAAIFTLGHMRRG